MNKKKQDWRFSGLFVTLGHYPLPLQESLVSHFLIPLLVLRLRRFGLGSYTGDFSPLLVCYSWCVKVDSTGRVSADLEPLISRATSASLHAQKEL